MNRKIKGEMWRICSVHNRKMKEMRKQIKEKIQKT